jgi:hypothetical protein
VFNIERLSPKNVLAFTTATISAAALAACGLAPSQSKYTDVDTLVATKACVRDLKGEKLLTEIEAKIRRNEGLRQDAEKRVGQLKAAKKLSEEHTIPCSEEDKSTKAWWNHYDSSYRYNSEQANDPACLQKVESQKAILPPSPANTVEYYENPGLYTGPFAADIHPAEGIEKAQFIAILNLKGEDCINASS